MNIKSQNPHLIIIPSVAVWKNENMLSFDRKFYDGIELYTKVWPGTVSCILSMSKSSFSDFGVVNKTIDELPFRCIMLGTDESITVEHLTGASIVLASADADNQLHISALCRKSNIKCVYVIEYIPETRYQITLLSTRNPFILLRRFIYIWQHEKKGFLHSVFQMDFSPMALPHIMNTENSKITSCILILASTNMIV